MPNFDDNVIRPPRFQGPSSGDGDGGDNELTLMKDYVDARGDAIESRLSAKLDKLPSSKEMWAVAIATVGSILTIVIGALAFLAFAGDRFDAGMSVSPTIQAVQESQAKVDSRQDAQLNVMDQKLDVIITQTAKR